MVTARSVSRDSVVVLFKGGRLPTWHGLTPETQQSYSQQHVDLMLSIARKHRLMKLEGFKLWTPYRRWERFWIIEFPDLEGAEEWIDAEVAPSYGSYGYHDYYLARRLNSDPLPSPIVPPRAAKDKKSDGEPRIIPTLDVDRDSVVVLLFSRLRPDAAEISPEERGDTEHVERMRAVALDRGLMRMEVFRLIGLQSDWHQVRVAEFPTFEGAEAWVECETLPPRSRYHDQAMYLAWKWAPDYFASWLSR